MPEKSFWPKIQRFFVNLISIVLPKIRQKFIAYQTKNHDYKLVFQSLSKKRPSFSHIAAVKGILNQSEQKKTKIAFWLILAGIIGLVIQFYFSHTKLVPVVGGSYTEGLVGAPMNINPILAGNNDVDRDIGSLIFSGLMKVGSDGTLGADLADKYEISPDHKAFTFYLKSNVNWHDGKSFSADDVVFTINSIQDPEWRSPLRPLFQDVSVEKLGDYIVRFNLKEPLANFLGSMTVGILPQHLWQTIPAANVPLAELNKKPIGTGLFKFKNFTKDKNGNILSMILEQNVDYYGQKSFLTEIDLKFYGDFDSAAAALGNKNVQGLSYLPRAQAPAAARNKDLKYYSLSLPQYSAIFFNTKRNEILKSQKVRQALAYAIDRQKILEVALDQQGAIINGPILPGFIGFNPDSKKYDFKTDGAAKLLDSDGWKMGSDGVRVKNKTRLSISLVAPDTIEFSKAIEVIKNNWQSLGIEVKVENIDKSQIRSEVIEPRNYEALIFTVVTKENPQPLWHSSQITNPGNNLAVWSNRDVDRLLEEANTSEPDTRAQKYRDFQDIIVEQVPAIFLYNQTYLYPVNEKILGLSAKRINLPADRWQDIQQWYIKTKRNFSWSSNQAK